MHSCVHTRVGKNRSTVQLESEKETMGVNDCFRGDDFGQSGNSLVDLVTRNVSVQKQI